jgi:hypothetical protein
MAAAAVVLEDGGGAAVLGGGFGQRLKIAAVALGSGCGRRTCDDSIVISIVKAKGYYHNGGLSVSKDGKSRHFRCKGCMLAAMARR